MFAGLIGAFANDGYERKGTLEQKAEEYKSLISYPDFFILIISITVMLFLLNLNNNDFQIIKDALIKVCIIVFAILFVLLRVGVFNVNEITYKLPKYWEHSVPSFVIMCFILSQIFSTIFKSASEIPIIVGVCLIPAIYSLTLMLKAYIIIPIKIRLYALLYKLKFKLTSYPNYIYIADALLKTLCKIGRIKTAYWKIEISYKDGILKLVNATTQEKKNFMSAMDDIFNQNKTKCNYILKIKQQNDKIIIPPKTFDENATNIFAKELEKYYGKVEVTNASSQLGKRELLKARYNQFIQATAKEKRTWLPRK